MIEEEYMTKEVKLNYKSKDYSIAICPKTNNQYHIGGKTDEFLTSRSFMNVTEAKKQGWEFK